MFAVNSNDLVAMFITAEGPLNCLSLHKDCTQVVAASRNVFKIYGIEEDSFVEKCNLRIGRNVNLNYSAVDVAWNPMDEHLLASAATNGAVVTWNLNKSSRNKQDLVFTEHKRCVSRVAFHANEYHMLLSGSQDGHMKLFDTRKKDVSSSYNGKSDSVRDVQFNPHHYFVFVASFDNGNVQIWDMRNPSRWERQFTAHNGPVFSIDIHPDEKHWIATSGRDKLIKIWDLTNPQKCKNCHSVQTIASISRIKWRPQRKYHLASCSLLVDFSVNIWDIRRPYIPFASFNEHKDIVTGVQWKQNEPHSFFSCGKDCNLYFHHFKDADRPADHANPVGVDINLRGNIIQATSDKLLTSTNTKSSYTQTMLPSFFKRVPDRTEKFTMVTSVLSEFNHFNLEESLSMEWFVKTAQNYRLTGASVEELCEHNAEVAKSLDRQKVAQTWLIIKLLFSCSPVTPPPLQNNKPVFSKGEYVTKEEAKPSSEKKDQADVSEKKNKDKVHNSTGSDDESESDPEHTDLINIASRMGTHHNSGDLFFGDSEVEHTDYPEFDLVANLSVNREWALPTEAFSIRHDIESRRAQSPDPLQAVANESPSDTETDSAQPIINIQPDMEDQIRHELLGATTFLQSLTEWDFKDTLCDVLYHHAEQGDVQMASCILIVLGNKIRPLIDQVSQEQWFMSYIDLLNRFEMYTHANEIIKHCDQPAVSALNQQSTCLHISCGICNKPQMRAGWLCERCKSLVHTCSVCHLPVKGLFSWCQGCSHGGHVEHIQDWHAKHKVCPTGCGHLCEYT